MSLASRNEDNTFRVNGLRRAVNDPGGRGRAFNRQSAPRRVKLMPVVSKLPLRQPVFPTPVAALQPFGRQGFGRLTVSPTTIEATSTAGALIKTENRVG
jgi:hypothetical protein